MLLLSIQMCCDDDCCRFRMCCDDRLTVICFHSVFRSSAYYTILPCLLHHRALIDCILLSFGVQFVVALLSCSTNAFSLLYSSLFVLFINHPLCRLLWFFCSRCVPLTHSLPSFLCCAAVWCAYLKMKAYREPATIEELLGVGLPITFNAAMLDDLNARVPGSLPVQPLHVGEYGSVR